MLLKMHFQVFSIMVLTCNLATYLKHKPGFILMQFGKLCIVPMVVIVLRVYVRM